MWTSRLISLKLRDFMVIYFSHLLFILLLGTAFVRSTGQSETWSHTDSRSSLGDPLHRPFTTGRSNLTEHHVQRRRRRNTEADTAPGTLPLHILASDRLSVLKDLVSDKKITVRLGLHVSLTGPSEKMDPQFLLALGKEPAIYNTGAGVFTMRVLGVRRLSSEP